MIPDQLASNEPTFLRLAPRSKAPQKGNYPDDGPHFHLDDEEIVRHIERGGNVGRVLRDDLIAIDVDDNRLAVELTALSETFTVKSGGAGYGSHQYYRCPGWRGNQSELTIERTNVGSVRSGTAYCVVPPSIHGETGQQYRAANSADVATISPDDLNQVLDAIKARDSTANTGGAAGGAPGVGGGTHRGTDEPIPDEYPCREAAWSTARKWLEANGLYDRINQQGERDRSGDEFVVAKCLAEGGFAPEVIREALDRFDSSSKWHQRGENYRRLTVQKAIEAAVDDPYVEFDTDDGERSSAPKPEAQKRGNSDGGATPSNQEVQTMADFEDHEEVPILEGNEEGDTFKKVVRSTRTEDGETIEYVSIKKGRVIEVTLQSGETGLTERVTDSTSIGSPAYIGDLAEALQELDKKINAEG